MEFGYLGRHGVRLQSPISYDEQTGLPLQVKRIRRDGTKVSYIGPNSNGDDSISRREARFIKVQRPDGTVIYRDKRTGQVVNPQAMGQYGYSPYGDWTRGGTSIFTTPVVHRTIHRTVHKTVPHYSAGQREVHGGRGGFQHHHSHSAPGSTHSGAQGTGAPPTQRPNQTNNHSDRATRRR